MPRGNISRARKAVSEQLRRFVAALLTQFRSPPEELLQKAEAKLTEGTPETNRKENVDGRRQDESQ